MKDFIVFYASVFIVEILATLIFKGSAETTRFIVILTTNYMIYSKLCNGKEK